MGVQLNYRLVHSLTDLTFVNLGREFFLRALVSFRTRPILGTLSLLLGVSLIIDPLRFSSPALLLVFIIGRLHTLLLSISLIINPLRLTSLVPSLLPLIFNIGRLNSPLTVARLILLLRIARGSGSGRLFVILGISSLLIKLLGRNKIVLSIAYMRIETMFCIKLPSTDLTDIALDVTSHLLVLGQGLWTIFKFFSTHIAVDNLFFVILLL